MVCRSSSCKGECSHGFQGRRKGPPPCSGWLYDMIPWQEKVRSKKTDSKKEGSKAEKTGKAKKEGGKSRKADAKEKSKTGVKSDGPRSFLRISRLIEDSLRQGCTEVGKMPSAARHGAHSCRVDLSLALPRPRKKQKSAEMPPRPLQGSGKPRTWGALTLHRLCCGQQNFLLLSGQHQGEKEEA